MRLKPKTLEKIGETSLALAVAHVVFMLLQPIAKGELTTRLAIVGTLLAIVFFVVGVILLERSYEDE